MNGKPSLASGKLAKFRFYYNMYNYMTRLKDVVGTLL